MLARIISNKLIQLEQITYPEEDIINKALSARDPRARYIDITMGNFDGWYRKYNSKYKQLNRALLGELRKICDDNKLPLMVVDERGPTEHPAPDPSAVTKDLLPNITLEQYQIDAIKSVCKAEVGLLELPTGSGKTEIAAGIVKLFNCPTVIIAEQKVVVSQIKERLELREVASEVGLFIAGRRPNGQLVIAGSLAALVIPQPPKRTEKDTDESYARKIKAYNTRRKNAAALRKMVAKCDLLIVDEADRATNKQYRNLFRFWYNGRRKYGLSGTMFDPARPVENLHLKENLGSIIHYTSRDEVLARKRIVPFAYTAIALGNPADRNKKEAYDIAVNEYMINNPEYHRLITNLAIRSIKDNNYGTLILIDSIPLGKTLEEILRSQSVPVEFIYGGTADTKRDEILKLFEEREIRVLIGSKILKRGLDLDGGCETLIIARDDKKWSELIQIIGRAVRLNKIGRATVYDAYLLYNHYLYNHSRDRIRHVVQTTDNARVIFGNKIVSARDLIRSRFRIPK